MVLMFGLVNGSRSIKPGASGGSTGRSWPLPASAGSPAAPITSATPAGAVRKARQKTTATL